MKKIFLTIVSAFMLLNIAFGGTYELILTGTTVEVWLNPTITTTAFPSISNQVVVTTDASYGASLEVIANYEGAVWGSNSNYLRVETNAGMDYIAIGSSNGGNTLNVISGVPIHLFDFTLTCNTGEVSLMDNNDPNRPPNFGNLFQVVAVPQGPMDLYDGNAGVGITCAGALPVELMSFSGYNAQEGNQLRWQTASELNNAGFEVEKSDNGRDWKMINWVEGKGTTQLSNNYELLDREPFIGDNYYRLKQIDFDGAFEYSNVINIRSENSTIEIKILPNPSPGDVNVMIANPDRSRMQVTLFDSAGHLIYDSGVLEDFELWKKQFNLPQKEVYFLQAKIGEKIFTEKILIIDRA